MPDISPVLSPDGQAMFAAGGDNAWKTATFRGYNVSLEWIRLGRHTRSCMVIWPATNVLVRDVRHGMWVITIRAIADFVGFTKEGKATGGPSEHCIREARRTLGEQMGKDPNDQQALNALIECVVKFADDLVLMPPAPPMVRKQLAGAPTWDLTLKDKNTGRVIKEETV